MSAGTEASGSPTSSAIGYLRSHRRAALALLDMGDQFTRGQSPPVVARNLRWFAAHGVVEAVDRTKTASGSYRVVWSVPEGVAAWIDRSIEREAETPCGHSGVRCLVAGERYTCTEDGCTKTFGAETAREVIQ